MDQERIGQEAAAWLVRLSDSCEADDRSKFEAWCAQSAYHEVAYLRAKASWKRLDRLASLNGPPVVDNPDALFDITSPKPVQKRRVRPWRLAAASIAVIAGVSPLVFLTTFSTQAYATGLNERKVVELADGSIVELNSNSRITVHFGQGVRSVQLVSGEALFHIARDDRPFVVKTKSVRLNTQMADVSVRTLENDSRVLVQRGAVLAMDTVSDKSSPPVSTLGPSSEITIGVSGTRLVKVSSEEVQRALAWRNGAIALDGETLSEAVGEFNRYNVRQIRIADSKTQDIQVGGYFLTTDVDKFVSAVSHTFPVVVSTDPDGTYVLTDKQPNVSTREAPVSG